MKRKLAVIVFSLSTVVCAAFWYASIKSVNLNFSPPKGMTVALGRGGVFLVSPLSNTVPFLKLTLGFPASYGFIKPKFSRGSIFGSGAGNIPGVWAAWIPIWPFVLGSVVLALVAWRVRRRPPPGHCPECGYNLKGNVTGICSECGYEIKSVVLGKETREERK